MRTICKITIEFVLYWPTTPEYGDFSDMWLIYPVRIHWIKKILPLPASGNCRKLLGQEWETMPTFPSKYGDPVWVKPVQVLSGLPQSLWVGVCVSRVISRRHCFHSNMHHHRLSQSSCLLFCTDLWAERGGFEWKYPIQDWVLQSLFSAHCLVVDLCSHLLQV